MKNILTLSISLILSISTFAQNTSVVGTLTAWAVEQQVLADRIAINYMATTKGFDRFNKIESELKKDIAMAKENSTNLNRSTLPASLILETNKVDKAMNALLDFVNKKPSTSEFSKFMELSEGIKLERNNLKEALVEYASTASTEPINGNALQVALAFNTQVSLSHKAVLCYLVNISDETNTNPSNGAFGAIMAFESNLMQLLELLGEDDTYQQYISAVLYDWKIIEKQLTDKKVPSKDVMISMLSTLSEVNTATLAYTNEYIKQIDNSPSATK